MKSRKNSVFKPKTSELHPYRVRASICNLPFWLFTSFLVPFVPWHSLWAFLPIYLRSLSTGLYKSKWIVVFSKWDFPSNLTHFQSTRVVFRIPKNPLEHVKFLPWLFFSNHIKSKFIIEKETQIGKLGPLWSELCLPIQLVIPSPNHSTPYPSFVRFMKYCQLPNTVTF